MPYVVSSQSDNGRVILEQGMFVDIFNELSRLLNFSYTTTFPPDGEWGALKDDGTWSGMIGQLQSKTVDLGLPVAEYTMNQFIFQNCFPVAAFAFMITEARSEVVSFSTPIDDVFHTVFIQNPIASYNYAAYTSPLTNITWIMFLVWSLVTPPILYILARLTTNLPVYLILFL